MEFPNLGKHCSDRSCQRLEFLPYTCERCKRVFCQDHRKFVDHNCPIQVDRVVPVCPLCAQIIPLLPGEDANEKVARHMDAGCRPEKSVVPILDDHACSMPRCKEKEHQKCICQLCNKNFCYKHKHPMDHECPKHHSHHDNSAPQPSSSSFLSTLSASQKRLQEAIKKFAESNNPTARKYAMIKMKQQAACKSNVPADKRFYIEVIYPLELQMDPKMFFFDESQRLGVVLDRVAEHAKIENQNNVAGARKLVILSLKTGEPIPLGNALKDSKNLVQSGDAVVLEYQDCVQ